MKLQMHRKSVVRLSFFSLAALLLLFAAWCLLWVFSSSDMAFTECAGNYDLFSSNTRCRQPPIAGLLSLASLILACVCALIGRKFRTVS